MARERLEGRTNRAGERCGGCIGARLGRPFAQGTSKTVVLSTPTPPFRLRRASYHEECGDDLARRNPTLRCLHEQSSSRSVRLNGYCSTRAGTTPRRRSIAARSDDRSDDRRTHPYHPRRSDDKPSSAATGPHATLLRGPPLGSNPDGSTPGALQGDDYPLNMTRTDIPSCRRVLIEDAS